MLIIETSFLPCVLEITADRFPDLCWSHDSTGAVRLPLCLSVCLSILWPGTLSISFVFFHLQYLLPLLLPSLFSSVFLADILRSLTIKVHTDTFVTFLYVCAPSFCLLSSYSSILCEKQMQYVGTNTGNKWQCRLTKKARWLLYLCAVDAIHLYEFPIVKQSNLSLTC